MARRAKQSLQAHKIIFARKIPTMLHLVLQAITLVLLAVALDTCTGEEIRILIKYREDSFLDEALSSSVGQELLANITSRRILAIKVENQGILDRLREDTRVESIEEDVIMNKLNIGAFEERDFFRIDGELRPDGEFIPYGIPLVQADQLWDIPPVQDDLQVCVVEYVL